MIIPFNIECLLRDNVEFSIADKISEHDRLVFKNFGRIVQEKYSDRIYCWNNKSSFMNEINMESARVKDAEIVVEFCMVTLITTDKNIYMYAYEKMFGRNSFYYALIESDSV